MFLLFENILPTLEKMLAGVGVSFNRVFCVYFLGGQPRA